MILDNMNNLNLYKGLGKNFDKALNYIIKTDLLSLNDGRYEIDGDDVFVMVSQYTTQDSTKRLMEAHYKYADIQVIMSGSEVIFYAPDASDMQLSKEYSDDNDCVFYTSGSFETMCMMQEGDFAVFFPNEFHKPCCNYNGSNDVKKAVFKIKMG